MTSDWADDNEPSTFTHEPPRRIDYDFIRERDRIPMALHQIYFLTPDPDYTRTGEEEKTEAVDSPDSIIGHPDTSHLW